jgi:hypothetical protein
MLAGSGLRLKDNGKNIYEKLRRLFMQQPSKASTTSPFSKGGVKNSPLIKA